MTELMQGAVTAPQQELVLGLMPAGTSTDSPVNVEWGNKTLSLSIAPLRADSGDITGSVVVFRDVSREAEISRMKSAFVSMVSHELRTPLNAIHGFAEILQQKVYGELGERQNGVVARILSNTVRLLGIVNDLLDQAHIEAGTMPIYNAPFSPAELVDGVVHSVVAGLAQSKGIEVESCIEPEVPTTLIGDSQRLGQVLVNLTTNALKFTEQGKVSIRLFCPDLAHWALQVSDTGPGIAPNAQTFIFEPFRQIEYSISRKHGGVGLGLSIVKKLVSLMNGDVSLHSEVGRGSTFTVVLPLVIP
jgi:two-component system sensor histidine kinase/response regulator